MNIEAMTLPELVELAEKIRRIAADRAKQYADIAGNGQDGRAINRRGGRHSKEAFVKVFREGKSVADTAREIGCHYSRARQVFIELRKEGAQ